MSENSPEGEEFGDKEKDDAVDAEADKKDESENKEP